MVPHQLGLARIRFDVHLADANHGISRSEADQEIDQFIGAGVEIDGEQLLFENRLVCALLLRGSVYNE